MDVKREDHAEKLAPNRLDAEVDSLRKELQKAQAACRESEERLSTLLAYAPEAIVMLDVESGPVNAAGSDRDSFDILVVEDNRADVVLLKKAFEEQQADCCIHVAINGDEALAFLYRQQPFADAPRPAIILLDLNLPGRDGREVLEEIKADDILRRIPIVVLSSSRSDVDVRQCYDLHANAFMTKAANFDELVGLVRQIIDYWLSAVRLPRS